MATALSLPDYNLYHMTSLLEHAAPVCRKISYSWVQLILEKILISVWNICEGSKDRRKFRSAGLGHKLQCIKDDRFSNLSSGYLNLDAVHGSGISSAAGPGLQQDQGWSFIPWILSSTASRHRGCRNLLFSCPTLNPFCTNPPCTVVGCKTHLRVQTRLLSSPQQSLAAGFGSTNVCQNTLLKAPLVTLLIVFWLRFCPCLVLWGGLSGMGGCLELFCQESLG